VLYIPFLLLAIFSKETGFLFGFITILYTFFFNKKLLPEIAISTFGVFTFYGIFRFFIAKLGFGQIAIAPISRASFDDRLLNIPAIITKYLFEFIFPLRLETTQLWIIKNASIKEFYLPLFVITLLIGITYFLYKKIDQRRKKNVPVFLFFLIWFLLGLSLHIQILPLDQTVAERWFYFPIVGLLGIVATAYYAISPKKILVIRSIVVMCVIILSLFSIRTYLRIFDWRDSETFFTHELQTDPHNFLIENYLGSIYLDKQDYKKATPLIVDSIKQYPYLGNLNSMAIIETHNKKIAEADSYFTQALHYGSTYTAYENYANFLLYIKKDVGNAYHLANAGIQKYPEGGDLYLVRAQTEYTMGNKTQALKDAKIADRALATPLSNEVFSAILFNRKINYEKFIKY
jgi:tetratricopeptide (TPR) repeat protein